VALPNPPTSASDSLTEAAREYVRAANACAAAWESRFNGRRQSWMKHGFGLSFIVPLKLARDGYRERAMASTDPFHRHVAMLLDSVPRAYFGLDGPIIRLLQNWLRDEPRMETRSATSWIAVGAPRIELPRARHAESYTVTLSLEIKRALPPSTVLYVDVGTEVASAMASVNAGNADAKAKADVIWKESRIWVMLGEARLEEGDLVNITVSSAKRISRPESVRIAKAGAEAGRADLVLVVNL
jgi:hypothetical protein